MRRFLLCFVLVPVMIAACGARTELSVGPPPAEGEGGGGGIPAPCVDGVIAACGLDVGVCSPGTRVCVGDTFGPCQGAVGPFEEACNELDDDCDGVVDNGFGVGEACDGDDSDACADDVMTCGGCTHGTNNVEICNGKDENCNGIIDADCEVGNCEPTLVVTGSTPSSPNCVDFPVEAGSKGVIQYPCGGGAVTATMGSIQFTGTVQNGVVALSGTAQIIGPDGCTWQMNHFIDGNIPSGTLTYSYTEFVVMGGPFCWQPCTEIGEVEIKWTAEP
ncbi:hypothetical protein [Polyangium sp. 6x1]|uniref:hypothetical protein n=1 Tax=Polyangium sp. 6x1 TaxID=3042689 RepID=UPI0032B1E53E